MNRDWEITELFDSVCPDDFRNDLQNPRDLPWDVREKILRQQYKEFLRHTLEEIGYSVKFDFRQTTLKLSEEQKELYEAYKNKVLENVFKGFLYMEENLFKAIQKNNITIPDYSSFFDDCLSAGQSKFEEAFAENPHLTAALLKKTLSLDLLSLMLKIKEDEIQLLKDRSDGPEGKYNNELIKDIKKKENNLSETKTFFYKIIGQRAWQIEPLLPHSIRFEVLKFGHTLKETFEQHKNLTNITFTGSNLTIAESNLVRKIFNTDEENVTMPDYPPLN